LRFLEIVPKNNFHTFMNRGRIQNCWEVRTVSEFIRHFAINVVSRGYLFYVAGVIPPGKDPAKVDFKITERYGIAISKWARWRQRQKGLAGIQYLRCRRHFVIAATHGTHRFFQDEGTQVRDIRRFPFRLGGYTVGFKEGDTRSYVSVKIEKERFDQLTEYLGSRAIAAPVEELVHEIQSFGFPLFGPVRRQLFVLVNTINNTRKTAGLEKIPWRVVVPQARPVGPSKN
jgi:hypothetical protein